jgi:hypothetical protein
MLKHDLNDKQLMAVSTIVEIINGGIWSSFTGILYVGWCFFRGPAG